MIRRRYLRSLNEGSLNRHESVQVKDPDYILNNCQGFGSRDSIMNLFADLRAMLKNSRKAKSPEDALYLLQSIRNTCDEISGEAQSVIDQSAK